MASLQKSGLLCAIGIATSLTNRSQQWDFPNGWAPVEHLIAKGLLHSGSEEVIKLAEDIATRYIGFGSKGIERATSVTKESCFFFFLADSSVTTQPERYLIIRSGGLNQQRTRDYACASIGSGGDLCFVTICKKKKKEG